MELTHEQKKYCERLQQVVRVMREVKATGKLFSLRYWGTRNEELIQDMIDEGLLPEGACGTVACAIGWVGLDPWFRRRGFRTMTPEEVGEPPDETFVPHYASKGEVVTDWVAILEFFNITEYQADVLFLEGYYPETKRGQTTALDVATKVNEFIGTKYGNEHMV